MRERAWQSGMSEQQRGERKKKLENFCISPAFTAFNMCKCMFKLTPIHTNKSD